MSLSRKDEIKELYAVLIFAGILYATIIGLIYYFYVSDMQEVWRPVGESAGQTTPP